MITITSEQRYSNVLHFQNLLADHIAEYGVLRYRADGSNYFAEDAPVRKMGTEQVTRQRQRQGYLITRYYAARAKYTEVAGHTLPDPF